jgi:AbrB family looped-hinge helix DNA binding protein
MSQSFSKVTAQGQVTVPADVRRALGLAPGVTLEWEAKDGVATVRRAGRFSSRDVHAALFPEGLQDVKVDTKAAIADYVRRRHARD